VYGEIFCIGVELGIISTVLSLTPNAKNTDETFINTGFFSYLLYEMYAA